MIGGWVKNIIFSVIPGGLSIPGRAAEQVGQGVQAFERKARAKLIDVTDGLSLAEEARKRREQLFTIVRKGGSTFDRFRFWIGARRKVKNNLADFYDMPEILDEVTERIAEAAQHDPFYKRLFS